MRDQIKELHQSVLIDLWRESLLWDESMQLGNEAVSRSIHARSALADVPFTLFSTWLYAEVWRELYVRSMRT